MTALSFKNRNLYDKIGHKDILLPEFTSFLKQLMLFSKSEINRLYGTALLYIGVFGNQQFVDLEREFQNLGIWDSSGKEEGAFEKQFDGVGRNFSQWGDLSEPVFPKIYERLEGLRTFEK